VIVSSMPTAEVRLASNCRSEGNSRRGKRVALPVGVIDNDVTFRADFQGHRLKSEF
jgi:hypothetical protein